MNVSFSSHLISKQKALREEAFASDCHSKNLNKVLISHSGLLMRR